MDFSAYKGLLIGGILMPSNKVAITLILISLLPLGMTLQAIFFSGSEVVELPLKGRDDKTAVVRLDPDMNPLRLLITMDYGSKAFSTVQRHIKYVVSALDKNGRTLWTEDGRASVSGDSKAISNQTHYSSLQTFDIDVPTEVQFKYTIEEANLRYKGGHLTLKRNVTHHSWTLTITGLVMLVSGILIFSLNQKKAQAR
jgi:hypothetical protein